MAGKTDTGTRLPVTIFRAFSQILNRCEGIIKTNAANHAERAAVASSLQRISDAIAEAPDVDHGKIQNARDLLSRDAYRVDPRRIADKLIRLGIAPGRAR